MTSTRRRCATVVALLLAAAVSACGSDSLVLPSQSDAGAIAIVSGDAQSAAAGAPLAQPLVVLVTDGLDRPIAGASVAFTIDAGGGQVTPASVATDPDGHASAAWTLGPTAGPQRVQAAVVGASTSLKVVFSATALSGSGAALVVVSGDHQTGPVKSALADSLVVRVTDALGNAVPGVQVDWTVTGGGSVSPASTLSDGNGLAAAQRVLGSVAGAQGAQAAVAGLTPVSFAHTAIAANPTVLLLVSGDGQTGAAGAALADSLVVRLEDPDGNGVGSKGITWLVASGGGSVSPVNLTTDPNGFAKTQWTLGTTAGLNQVNAVYSGLPSVQFTATAGAGAPTRLAFLQSPVNTSAGASITPPVRVAIQDANGNTVSTATAAITLAIGANPSSGTLSGTKTVSAVSGVASFSNLSIDKAGTGYTLTASATGLTGATSSSFDILTGSANRLAFLVGPTDRVVGQPFSPAIQVQVQDAAGNPILTASNQITLTASVTGSLTGTSTATPLLGTATFSNLAVSKAGPAYTLTALSSGLVSATSVAFDVAQASTTTAITGRNPTSSVPGQNVTVSYDVNVVAPGAGSLSGTVTVTDGTTSCTGGVTGAGTGSCTLAFPDVGTHQLTATYSGDANLVGSASAPVSHTVNKAGTAITITQDTPDFSLVGDAVTVRWNLTSSATVPLTGTVTLTVSGGSETCASSAALGNGSCDLTFTINGSRTITASYGGDGNYSGSSDTEGHTVKGQTSTSVASSANPSVSGQNVTFTAHVTAVTGAGSLSGQVIFLDGATQIGSNNLNASGDATLTTSALTVGSHSITAVYQGSTLFDGSASSALTQQINPANTAPTAVADGPYTMLEDGTLNVNHANGVLANDTDPQNDPLTASLVTGPSHAQSFTLNPNGSFSYVPDPDYNGGDSFTYQANDGSLNSNTATVTISITAVNDAPSFIKGSDQTVAAGAGPQTVAGWATAISPGPADESAQTVSFDVTVSPSDQGEFTTLPQVDSSGTLSYEPNPGSLGATVTVTIRAVDNGGTANGGVDTSADQTFTITITP